MPAQEYREEYLLIQRRWGFVVLQFTSSPRSFERDRARFLAVRDGLKLEPELPGGPVTAPAALLLGLAGAVFARRWARRWLRFSL